MTEDAEPVNRDSAWQRLGQTLLLASGALKFLRKIRAVVAVGRDGAPHPSLSAYPMPFGRPFAKPLTAEADNVLSKTYTVPADEIWLLEGCQFGHDDGTARLLTIEVQDDGGNSVQRLFFASGLSASVYQWPNTVSANGASHSGGPVLMGPSWTVNFTINALTSADNIDTAIRGRAVKDPEAERSTWT